MRILQWRTAMVALQIMVIPRVFLASMDGVCARVVSFLPPEQLFYPSVTGVRCVCVCACVSASMSEQRLNVFPSRMALQTIKGKLIGAKRGYELLKKKSDALKSRIRTITQRIYKAMQSNIVFDNFRIISLNYFS